MSSTLPRIQLDQLPAHIQDPRILLGLLGVLLLFFGVRHYKLVLVAPGFALGVVAGLLITRDAALNTSAVAAVCLGVLGAGVLFFVERLAVGVLGAVLTAGLLRAALPLIAGEGLPWYVPAAAGLLGLFLFPRLFRALIRVLTPLLGALCIAWAVGRPDSLPLIGGLALVGGAAQMLFARSEQPQERES